MTTIPRDQYKRPLIIPLGENGQPDLSRRPVPNGVTVSGAPKWKGGVAYTRVSTMAKSLDDTSMLTLWKQRMTALGFVRRPDLITRVAALMAKHEDVNDDYVAKKTLNEIVDEAFEAAGGSAAASQGTALHDLTESLDAGIDVWPFAGEWKPRLEGYAAVMSNFEVLSMEEFVVNDEVQAAGSFDRLVRLTDVTKLNEILAQWGWPPVSPGVVAVGDLKTGRHDAGYPLGVATQIGTYSNASRYDFETGERSPLHSDLDPRFGLLMHMPAKGEGIQVYPLNLERGWYAARYARGVHDIRKWKVNDLRGEPVFSA